MPSGSSHPYYPLGADIVGYSPNQTPVLELLVKASGGCVVLLGLTFAVASYVRPTLLIADRIAILWFVLCMTPSMSEQILKEETRLTKRISWNSTLFL